MSDGQPRLLAGRYRVNGLLGQGGMSEVYHGRDERLDRPVAIKVLKPPLNVPAAPDSPEAAEILDALDRDRKRFLREIRVTAQLEHPGIPAVYDTGVEQTDGGLPQLWLVMQLLRGSTLETLLDHTDYGSPPPVSWAAAIVAQIAAVLADLHRVDIVHRDIKPGNVMIIDGGLVKVLDFGIAILRGAGALPRLTQVDRTVGTPAYMSPEQSLGQAVTAASDIYSLGCLCLELLTGDVPFHGTAGTPLRAHHLNTPAPSARSRRADVPQELDQLVSSMLAKAPEARPAATAVYEALLTWVRTGPEADEGGPAGDTENPAGSVRRDPTRPFRWPLLAPPPAEPAAQAGGLLTDAEAAVLLDTAHGLLDRDRISAAVTLLERGVERAADDPGLQLRLRHQLGAAFYLGGQYTRAAATLEAARKDYQRVLGPHDPAVLDCAYQAGYAYAQIGKTGRARAQLSFYVQNAQDSRGEDEAHRTLEARFLLAQLLATDGEFDDALAELRAVRPLLAETFGPDSIQIRNLDKQANRWRPRP